jgi:carbon storage regulator CsrA
MLVIARKRHEAILIGREIRIEVLRLTGGVARLRFTAPRHFPIARGVAKNGSVAGDESAGAKLDESGAGTIDLTLGNQQIITIGDAIHLGLISADSTRALLVVEAPDDLAVTAHDAAKPRAKPTPSDDDAESHQGLLPFPSSPAPDADNHPHDTDPHTLPFEPGTSTIPFARPREPER